MVGCPTYERGREFDPRPGHGYITTLGKLCTPMPTLYDSMWSSFEQGTFNFCPRK